MGDHDDDVRTVASSCLLPVASQLVQQLPDYLGTVIDVLWNCLAEMKDDLSSSVGAVMELLGTKASPHLSLDQLVTYNRVMKILGDPASS